MMWTAMLLSLGIVIWWGIGLGIGMYIGHRNGLELAEIDGPDEPQIFGSDNAFAPTAALSPEEIDEMDEMDEWDKR